jgi:hypothetical protein
MPFRRRPERQSAPPQFTRFWQSVAFLEDTEGELVVHFVYQNVVPEGAHLRVACLREGKVTARLQPGRQKRLCPACGNRIGETAQLELNAKEETAVPELADKKGQARLAL